MTRLEGMDTSNLENGSVPSNLKDFSNQLSELMKHIYTKQPKLGLTFTFNSLRLHQVPARLFTASYTMHLPFVNINENFQKKYHHLTTQSVQGLDPCLSLLVLGQLNSYGYEHYCLNVMLLMPDGQHPGDLVIRHSFSQIFLQSVTAFAWLQQTLNAKEIVC